MPKRYCTPVLLLAAAAVACAARGDVYQLKEGGEVVGELVERTPSDDYVVRTAEGVELTLPLADLERIVQQDKTLAEYQQRSRTIPDTAEAHRQLAAWCKEHALAEEAEHHLNRVLELEPNDEDARRSLGYQFVGGRWLNRDELMTARGLQFFDGKYRTPQDIAIRQRDKEEDAAEVDWFTKLRTWRGWLASRKPDRVDESQAHINAISDPHATAPLVKLLKAEEDPWIFNLLLAAVGRQDHPLAVQTLVGLSLESTDEEVRMKCLDYLTGGGRQVSLMPYVQALKDKDNKVVNRAGEALGKIGNPAAVSPLIDALVTRHKYQVQSSSPGEMNASFSPNGGGGGFSFGGNGPKIIEQDRENAKVLEALIKLTGNTDMGYDKQAWRHWFVDKQMHEKFNSRRDD